MQNGRFVELASKLEEATRFAEDYPLKIATMGCRVNGPGETDDADAGLWCGVDRVNLKSRGRLVGAFSYDEVVERAVALVREEIARYDAERRS